MVIRKFDGDENLSRVVPPSLITLFHHDKGDEPKCNQKMEKIHTNPAIYLVKNFLSPTDIDYFDREITQNGEGFGAGKLEIEKCKAVASDVGSLTYMSLNKGRDANICSLEMKVAGEAVGRY